MHADATLGANATELIPLTAAHAVHYIRLANEPSIRDRVNNPIPYEPGHFTQMLSDMEKNPHLLVWMIAHNGLICGAINSSERAVKGIYQGGYWLDPAYRGRGIACASLNLVNDFLFTEMKAERVQALVEPDNQPSIKVLEKCGYEREGFLRKFYPSRYRGLLDVFMYARIRA